LLFYFRTSDARELSKSIIEADYHTQQQLQEEAANLFSIQAMKRSLERQLAAIKTEPAVAEERVRLADSQEQQQNYLKQLTPNKGNGKSSSNRVEQINQINLALKAADEAGFGSRSMDSLDGARYEVTQTCHNLTQNCHNLTRNCNPRTTSSPVARRRVRLPGAPLRESRCRH
jgi:hypothetical protein